MCLETILAELPQLTEEERKIIEDMICDLSDQSSRERLRQPASPRSLLASDYWTKVFDGWRGKGEEGLPEDFSLNHDHYMHGAPREW